MIKKLALALSMTTMCTTACPTDVLSVNPLLERDYKSGIRAKRAARIEERNKAIQAKRKARAERLAVNKQRRLATRTTRRNTQIARTSQVTRIRTERFEARLARKTLRARKNISLRAPVSQSIVERITSMRQSPTLVAPVVAPSEVITTPIAVVVTPTIPSPVNREEVREQDRSLPSVSTHESPTVVQVEQPSVAEAEPGVLRVNSTEVAQENMQPAISVSQPIQVAFEEGNIVQPVRTAQPQPQGDTQPEEIAVDPILPVVQEFPAQNRVQTIHVSGRPMAININRGSRQANRNKAQPASFSLTSVSSSLPVIPDMSTVQNTTQTVHVAGEPTDIVIRRKKSDKSKKGLTSSVNPTTGRPLSASMPEMRPSSYPQTLEDLVPYVDRLISVGNLIETSALTDADMADSKELVLLGSSYLKTFMKGDRPAQRTVQLSLTKKLNEKVNAPFNEQELKDALAQSPLSLSMRPRVVEELNDLKTTIQSYNAQATDNGFISRWSSFIGMWGETLLYKLGIKS